MGRVCYLCGDPAVRKAMSYDFCEDCWQANFYWGSSEDNISLHPVGRYVEVAFKGTRKKGDIITDPRFVGVEIETGLSRSRTKHHRIVGIPKNVGIAIDGSGLEFILPPANLASLEENVRSITDTLKELGYSPNRRDGLHIHLDGRKIAGSETTQKRILLNYMVFERVFVNMLPRWRANCQWCHPPSRVARGDYETIKDKPQINPETHKGNSKGIAINLCALEEHETIEIRWHEGTQDADDILNWIALNQAVLKARLSHKTILEYMEIRNLKKQAEFMCETLKLSDITTQYVFERLKKHKWEEGYE